MIAGEQYNLRELVYDHDEFRKYEGLTIGELNATYAAVAKEEYWRENLFLALRVISIRVATPWAAGTDLLIHWGAGPVTPPKAVTNSF